MRLRRVVLHRLRLDDARRELLERSGVEVVVGGSVRRTLEAAGDGDAVVVVDLGVGSNAPERIARSLLDLDAEVALIATSRSGRSGERAARMGLPQVYQWPEGVFLEIVRRCDAAPQLTVRRHAARVEVNEAIDLDSIVDGVLVNISARGALMDVSAEHEDAERFTLEIEVGGVEAELLAEVRWSQPVGDRVRLGCEFVGLTDELSAALERFVMDAHILWRLDEEQAFVEASGTKVRVQREGDTRVDYFQLAVAEDGDGWLIPKSPFEVPWALGDTVVVKPLRSGSDLRARWRLVERRVLDPGQLKSRVGWRAERVEAIPRSAAGDR